MTIFLTGSTGLIGSYLLKMFLERGDIVYALARKDQELNAKERLFKILNFWKSGILENRLNHLIVLKGDITKKRLGLKKEVMDLMGKQVDQVFHCAALTKFNSNLGELKEVNVGGLRKVLDLGLQWKKNGKLKKINYLSTVYISGDYKGAFQESDLKVNQKFNTSYQVSKFEAEKLVEKYRKAGLCINIYRTPAVAGESQSGKVPVFNQALYQTLHLINLGIYDSLPIKNQQRFHMVCVDELCKSILILADMAKTGNRNFHNFNHKGILLRSALTFFVNYSGLKNIRFVSFDKFNKEKPSPVQKKIFQHNLFFLNSESKLNSLETNRILRTKNFNFSSLNGDLFLKLISYAVKSGFLKKK